MGRTLVLLALAAAAFAAASEAKYTKEEEEAMMIEFNEHSQWPRLQDDDVVPCMGGNDCCNPGNQCGLLEGDCDTDDDCMGTLVCGIRNCHDVNMPEGWPRSLTEAIGSDDINFSATDDCCQFREGLVEFVNGM